MITSRLPSAIHALAGETHCALRLRVASCRTIVRVSYAPAERPARHTAATTAMGANTAQKARCLDPGAPLAAHGP